MASELRKLFSHRKKRTDENAQPQAPVAVGNLAALRIDKDIASITGDVENKEKLMAALRSLEVKDAPQGP